MQYPTMYQTLLKVAAERARQDEKWGEQNHPDFLPDPSSGYRPGFVKTIEFELKYGKTPRGVEQLADYYQVPPPAWAKFTCEKRASRDCLTWMDILLEEVAELVGTDGEDDLKEELIQVAAVAVAWIEAIDRRKERRDEKPR